MVIAEAPKVVEGTLIRTSRSKLLFLSVCWGLFGFAAVFILWDTWGHQQGGHILPFQLAKDSLHTSFVVFLCAFGGVLLMIALAYKWLFPEQLILGEEVLQVIQSGFLGPTVETQIPYANIAAVTCERQTHGFGEVLVGIDLHCLSSSGTFSPGLDFGQKNRKGRDCYLPQFLAVGPEDTVRLIEERRQGRKQVGGKQGAAAEENRATAD